MQAAKCRASLSDIHFDHCFASPISRAKVRLHIAHNMNAIKMTVVTSSHHSAPEVVVIAVNSISIVKVPLLELQQSSDAPLHVQTSAELIWSGREEPLIYLDSLREANLNILEGMKNGGDRDPVRTALRAPHGIARELYRRCHSRSSSLTAMAACCCCCCPWAMRHAVSRGRKEAPPAPLRCVAGRSRQFSGGWRVSRGGSVEQREKRVGGHSGGTSETLPFHTKCTH